MPKQSGKSAATPQPELSRLVDEFRHSTSPLCDCPSELDGPDSSGDSVYVTMHTDECSVMKFAQQVFALGSVAAPKAQPCGKNMGNDLLVIPCDLAEGHEGPCQRNVWPVNAGAPKAGEPPQELIERARAAWKVVIHPALLPAARALSYEECRASDELIVREMARFAESELRGAGETPAERPQPEKKAICQCGHKARSHGPNWNGESPEKEATGFPVCHYPGCKCMAYCAPLPPGAGSTKENA